MHLLFIFFPTCIIYYIALLCFVWHDFVWHVIESVFAFAFSFPSSFPVSEKLLFRFSDMGPLIWGCLPKENSRRYGSSYMGMPPERLIHPKIIDNRVDRWWRDPYDVMTSYCVWRMTSNYRKSRFVHMRVLVRARSYFRELINSKKDVAAAWIRTLDLWAWSRVWLKL